MNIQGIFFFFCRPCRGLYESEHTTHSKGGMRQDGREWEGQNSGEQTLGNLWKGEGWGWEHGVYKMDITGTFMKKSREFEGSGFGVD